MPNSPESSLTRQTLSSPPALRHLDVVERPALSLSADDFFFFISYEASAHMSDPVGIPYVFSTVFLLEPCFPLQTTFYRL